MAGLREGFVSVWRCHTLELLLLLALTVILIVCNEVDQYPNVARLVVRRLGGRCCS